MSSSPQTPAEVGKEEKKQLELAQGFGLSADEFKRLRELLGRSPSLEEIAVTGALWSEHCSYKSSRVHLSRFHTQEPWVLQGPGENAGIVEIAEGVGLAFKMESHNHPSYIEPYQGAATGVGGILRDVFCMGARPIANLNCLRYGEGDYNAHLLKHTVRGIGDYGNSVGVPTVGGQTRFHHGYSKNILVNAFTAGLVKSDAIFRGKLQNDSTQPRQQVASRLLPAQPMTAEKRSELFPSGANLLLYFGSATGRDGVHGATMSSDTFDDASAALKPTVQVGDPFAEKKLLEVTLELLEKKLVVGLQDMGAAGLTSSGVEMAGRSGCGVVIDLNLIPARTARLKAFEYLLSESQERMLCAVTPEKAPAVIELCRQHQVAAAVIGSVNDTGEFICLHNDEVVCVLPVGILTDNAPKYTWPLQDRDAYLREHARIERPLPADSGLKIGLPEETRKSLAGVLESATTSFAQAWPVLQKHLPELMSLPVHASKDPLTRHYCSTVQGNTIAGCQTPRSSAAALVRLDEAFVPESAHDTFARNAPVVALAAGCQERWIEIDPLHGAAQSTLLLSRRIVASGGRPLAMTDCLNFGSPRQPAVMRQISDAIDGINSVAKTMRIPIVSGNVSLNNQTGTTPIPPTPMVGIAGVVDSCQRVVGDLPSLTKNNSTSQHRLYWLCAKNTDSLTNFAMSEMAWNVFHKNNGPVPQADFASEMQMNEFLAELNQQQHLNSCAVAGCGGVLMTLLTMAARTQSALAFTKECLALHVQTLFAEGQAGVIVSGPALADQRIAGQADARGLRLVPLADLISCDSLAPTESQVWKAASAQYSDSLKSFFR
ncbi:MAG: phosphoribosylformylglycinamidine synthase [Pseudomonadota bacterium]|jgi:phosphoribosylformylglycinamidine synthase